MACIPAGEFIRGVDSDDHDCGQPDQLHADVPSTSPAMRVEMSAYFMDVTEVTNAAYAACVAAGGCPESGPRYVDFGRDQQPIVGVSWYDAQAYCAWAGKSLPTEAQWEKAARGPDGELTPFGNDPVACDVAVIMDGGGHRSCGQMKERGEHPETGRVALVGSMPAGRYGLFDMVGNAEEWVADWWTENWTACGADCAGPDPTGPCGGAEECDGYRLRVVRGGSWYWPTGHATGYHRRRHYPANSPFHHFGFRCAASVEQAQALSAAAAAN
ncbi:MAG: formylglycine-generating enzyme family protein [Myxococcales bacterium]|nr:formylglycine-generating enzyme family protein [Myxococcales bacterium]MCB9519715.1 formylglycine-generating enzyme family protein [Myxococcales bacterium]MCB9530406.1 formylglycine-generating enzyme family protein [Myxococcales bacterium]MCB9533653.1 formylglycine-generating enzyme family protein [Myxococcales bacterium]